jgi:hypothetical protein
MTDAVDWQTPQTDSFRSRGLERRDEMGLDQQARFWATPNTPSGGPNTKSTATHTGGPDLDGQAAIWPTPQARDWKGGEVSEKTLKANARPLNEMASRFSRPAPETAPHGNGFSPASPDSRRLWATPRSAMVKNSSGIVKNGDNIEEQVSQWPTPRTEMDSGRHRNRTDTLHSKVKSLESRKKLNPDFVCWLQGMPHQWADITASINSAHMATWRSRFKSRLRFLLWLERQA